MATSCTSSATETVLTFFTSTSLSTTFSTITTVVQENGTPSNPCTTTVRSGTTFTQCVTSTAQPTPRTTIMTVPVVTTIAVTGSGATTLYGSSCRVVDENPNRGGGDRTPTTPTPPPVTPTIITTQTVTTLSDGQISTAYVTTTTTPQPDPTQSGPNSQGSPPTTPQAKKNDNLAPIIGGVVGGVVGLGIIVVAIWYIIKRRQRWDDIFEEGIIKTAIASPPTTGEPKPAPSKLRSVPPNVNSPPTSSGPPGSGAMPPHATGGAPFNGTTNQGFGATYPNSPPPSHPTHMSHPSFSSGGIAVVGAGRPNSRDQYPSQSRPQSAYSPQSPPSNPRRPSSDYFQGGFAHSGGSGFGGSGSSRPMSSVSGASSTAHLMTNQGQGSSSSPSSVSGTSNSGTGTRWSRNEKTGEFTIHNAAEDEPPVQPRPQVIRASTQTMASMPPPRAGTSAQAEAEVAPPAYQE